MPPQPFPDHRPDEPEPKSSAPQVAQGDGPQAAAPADPAPQASPADPAPQASPADPAPQDCHRQPGADPDAEPQTAADGDEDAGWDGVRPEWLAGDLTAEEISQAGFGEGGTADQMGPGPVLAGLVHAATRDEKTLAALSDDDLLGVIAAAQRTECRAVWAGMAATREFAARHRPGRDPAAGPLTSRGCFAADELAGKLNLSWQSAAGQMAYACTVADRLPQTFAALAAGKIHPVHVRIIEDETSILAPQDAAEADEKLAEAAQSKTFAQLRYAAHRLVLKLDPGAARRRKEEARKDAHVRRFREDSGNAGMVAREMPAEEVLASWQHVEQRALDLRAAGVPGTRQELRVRAYLDLLQERDARTVLGTQDPGQAGAGQGSGSSDDPAAPEHQAGPGHPAGPAGNGEPEGPPDGTSGPRDDPGGDSGPGADGPGRGPRSGPVGASPDGPDGNARQARRDTGPSIAALVTITVPLTTLQGDSDTPGEAAGFGLLDGDTARDLVAAASRSPDTRWCVTALHPDGTSAAHACAPGPHPGPPDPRQLKFNAVIRGPCNHAQAQHGYRPSRKLRHLVNARSTCCTAPGCSQPAARCDLDHTNPWHHGGPSCPCNLAPLCRHHHRCKQAQGWWLEQPEPGVLRWRTPSGRTYTTTPTVYPSD